ncbi:MAG: RsmE family RNA methyltransferase [Gemmataceae bacterium]
MSERFHINSELAPGIVTLQGPEAHHLSVVCRIRPGDAVCLFNGDGREYPARVLEVGKRAVTLEVLSMAEPQRELPFSLQVAIPLPRGDRAQFLVEKLTELGVQVLYVLTTTRSVVHPRETRLDKLERQVIEASKQCGRNTLMRIEGPIDLADLVLRADLPQMRLIAHPGTTQTHPFPSGVSAVALVGPEGGFTEDEVSLTLAHGWQPIPLGARILRMETAAMVLAARLGATSAPEAAATLL